MADENLDKELNQLWERVSRASFEAGMFPESPPPAPPAPSGVLGYGKEVAVEAAGFLRRRHREEMEQVRELLDVKEKTLSEIQERLASAEGEVSRVREEYLRKQDDVVVELGEAALKLEKAHASLRAQEEDRLRERASHQRARRIQLEQAARTYQADIARLRLEVEADKRKARQAREQLEKIQSYWERQEAKWRERDGRSRDRVRHSESALRDREGVLGAAEKEKARLESTLKSANEKIEELSEDLAKERDVRARVSEEKEAMAERNSELEARLREWQAEWNAEREEWRELWERERSTWEVQRREFADWETRLRREREAWLKEMKSREAEEVRHASQLTGVLKESTDWAFKVTALLKHFASRGVEILPGVGTGLAVAAVRRRYRLLLGFVSAAVVLALGSYPAYLFLEKIHLREVGSVALSLAAPTAVAAGNDVVWISGWEGELVAFSAGRISRGAIPVRRLRIPSLSPYHPRALSLLGDAFWSLDAAQSRLIRHDPDDPGRVLSSFFAPGPVPASVAYDGRHLWVFDVSSGKFHVQSPARPKSRVREVSLPSGMGGLRGWAAAKGLIHGGDISGIAPSSAQWVDGELWILDASPARGGGLYRFVLKGGGSRLEAVSSQRLPRGAVAFSVFEKNFYLITHPAEGRKEYVLRRFKIWL